MKHYVLAGRTGVGKSSFVNSTFGIELASTSPYQACTKLVEYHSQHTPFGEVCLIDTPGLAEGDETTDAQYLNMVEDRIRGMRLEALVYITPLNDTRVLRAEEKNALRLLTKHLGASIWASSWLVLTFAASVSAARREEAAGVYERSIAGYLKDLSEVSGSRCRFNCFRQVLLLDNMVADWSPGCKPLMAFLV